MTATIRALCARRSSMHVSNATPSCSCELIQADLDCNRGTAIGAGFLAVMASLDVARLRMYSIRYRLHCIMAAQYNR